MKKSIIFCLAGAACVQISVARDFPAASTVWFDTPVSSSTQPLWVNPQSKATYEWERLSLPIGNGHFGASVLGSVATDRLILNEKTLWHGGPAVNPEAYWNQNREVSDQVMPRIRALLLEGRNDEAYALLAENFRGTVGYEDGSIFGCFTVLGEARVHTGIDEASVSNYTRSLDIDNAVAKVEFDADGAHFTRTYFASAPDSVQVWRYTASKGTPQSLTFTLDTPQPIDECTALPGGALLYEGHLEDNGMRWAMMVRPVVINGVGDVISDAEPGRGSITVSGAPDVAFVISAATDYRLNLEPDPADRLAYVGENPGQKVVQRADNAARRGMLDLYSRHVDDYKQLYRKVKLSLGDDGNLLSGLTTPQRLEAYRQGAADRKLEELYFNYGRYLLIASSRPGSMPANLQGLWANGIDGPWHVDYHNNINVQMNYWPATTTNLIECFEPYVDYIRSLVVPGRETAGKMFGARGWTASISANIFGFTAPINSTDMTWNYNPTAGAWLASQLWDYYQFTLDRQWLESVGYPIIAESADFCADLLFELPDGTLTSAPSYSPEHGPISLGATYANAATRQILTDAIAAASELEADSARKADWEARLARITPYKIGRHGQLQEWFDDIDDPTDQHRHTNHLYGLHPGTTITMDSPELIEACKQTLRHRGDAATGWSMGWKLNHWARLHDGDHAYVLYGNLLKNGTADNLWDLHPPFQIDGNFGGSAGVAEMLLQSHAGTIELLPALPAAWADGHVSGLLARGGFEVDIDWADGRLRSATLRSPRGGSCTVSYAGQSADVALAPGESRVVTF